MVWLENNVHFLPRRLEKRSLFSETLAGISTLALWTLCIILVVLVLGGIHKGCPLLGDVRGLVAVRKRWARGERSLAVNGHPF